MKSVYKRVLLKVSGEALAGKGNMGINDQILDVVAEKIKKLREMGTQIAIVCGGGNFWRGAKNPKFDRSDADHMGMLATIMNALAIADKLKQIGVPAVAMSAIQMDEICEFFVKKNAVEHLENGKVVICAGGTGNPFFTTDTGAALRAAELSCDVILLAKSIDAVYDKDPATNNDAKKFDRISMAEVMEKNLKVMDITATAFCFENKIPIKVFGLDDPENIIRVASGEAIGTDVYL